MFFNIFVLTYVFPLFFLLQKVPQSTDLRKKAKNDFCVQSVVSGFIMTVENGQ